MQMNLSLANVRRIGAREGKYVQRIKERHAALADLV